MTLGLAVLCSACSRPPALHTPDLTNIAPSPLLESSRGEGPSTLGVSEAVARACALPQTAPEAPHFDFDRDELRPRGKGILAQLGACLREGPLRDHDVTLVGRADPRGPRSYNDQLAANRAEHAREFLVCLGVSPARIDAVSAGERGAYGYDEATWALDRRVDVELDGDEARFGRMYPIGTTSCAVQPR